MKDDLKPSFIYPTIDWILQFQGEALISKMVTLNTLISTIPQNETYTCDNF